MSSSMRILLAVTALSAALSLGLSGCSTVKNTLPSAPNIFGGKSKAQTNTGGTRIKTRTVAPRLGVNEYLWRSSLETLNFMPLMEIDPFGGVIITDWYASPQAPDERFKATVYILDTNLRADALKVSIFKQVRGQVSWNDASVDADTARTIENSILTRARELFIASADSR